MREILTFVITTVLAVVLVSYLGSKRKKVSRYERHQENDWQKLDKGIDPPE